MPRSNQNSIASQDNEESSFSHQHAKQIKNDEIKQLLKTKADFEAYARGLGGSGQAVLSPANVRYSKEILGGQYGVQEVSQLVEARVDKMIKNQKIKKNWCREDCTILAWVLERLTNGRHLRAPEKLKQHYWETAASLIPGATPDQCMFKWLSMKKVKLENNKWSANQCRILEKVVRENGHEDWKKVSRLLYLMNTSQDKKYRHPKQCRQQWNCYLNPALRKGPWSLGEDHALLKMVEAEGRKWSIICRKMLGRTQNALKNRYNFLIEHKRSHYPEASQSNLLSICLEELEKSQQSAAPPTKSPTSTEQAVKLEAESKKTLAICQQPAGQIKVQQPVPEQVTIVECNYQQFARFIRNNHILIPAKIEKNQLISFQGMGQKSRKIII